MNRLIVLALLLLASCEGDKAPSTPPSPEQRVWNVGPECINGSGSCNVAATPRMGPDGPTIDLPYSTGYEGHANYVTFRHGSLAGKSGLCATIRVNAPEGVNVRASKPLGEVWEGKATLYFERAGNDFTGGPTQNWYRWYATGTTTRLTTGEHRLCANFADQWSAVSYGANYCTADNNDPDCRGPAMFQEAVANADRVGFVLGGGDGLGHGVHADGPGASIVIVSYEVLP